MQGTFTAVFEKRGKWWIAYVEELPGANAQAETMEEARENLREAIELVIETNRDLARSNEFEEKNLIREEIAIKI